jgi:hypothetical protein
VRGQAVKCCDTFEPRVQGFAVVRRWTPARAQGWHSRGRRAQSFVVLDECHGICR